MGIEFSGSLATICPFSTLETASEGCPRAKREARSAPDEAHLSMGHISSTSEKKAVSAKPKPSQTSVRIWAKGSRCDFPGIQSSNPRLKHSPPPPRVPRGKIETLSKSSRRNLKLTLHTITFEALAYTMALTMPGNTDEISGASAKRRFIILCNRMTTSRIPSIILIGMMWKQELQKRGEVHFHLMLYGMTEDNRRTVQRWIAEQWNELICSRSTKEERTKHLWWNLRDGSTRSGRYDSKADNMQEVRDFAGYFAKYLGKYEKAQAARDPIPGRWWGKVNKKNIPWAELREIELPLRMRIHCQRIARKIRQKKAGAAKHLCIMRELDLVRRSGPNKGLALLKSYGTASGRFKAQDAPCPVCGTAVKSILSEHGTNRIMLELKTAPTSSLRHKATFQTNSRVLRVFSSRSPSCRMSRGFIS